MNFNNLKKIHFIGVGGIGISAVARMMLDFGKKVSGSDMAWNELIEDLEDEGLVFKLGHKEKNLPDDADLVVYSAAVPENNPERVKAKELKIKELSYPEILGEISKAKKTIAISGTKGKTTTTAMTGVILEAAKLDPLVIVGSKVKTFKEGNLRLGKGEYFVVEACEYKANFLNIEPKIIILTNIYAEHLDYYRDINHIKETFEEYIAKIPADGILILNADDPVSQNLKKPKCRVVTYGIKNSFSEAQPVHAKASVSFTHASSSPQAVEYLAKENKADIMAENIKTENARQYFNLVCSGVKMDGAFSLGLPGVFNIYNALAAITCGMELGIDIKIIGGAIENFRGTWRRFEKVGEYRGAMIISDYAHHPTSVAGTIKAAKEFYPTRRIVAVFEPHQHNRTKNLFKDFTESFDQADLAILSEIYDVPGREEKEDQNVSSLDLVREIKKRGVRAIYGENLEATKKLILENIKEGDVVLIMGAGNIYKVAEGLGGEVESMNYEV